MRLIVTLDWKFVFALGAATIGTIFALKIDESAAERVLIYSVDAGKQLAVAGFGNR